MTRRRDMETYADALWGERQGWVAVGFGLGGRFREGHYKFRGWDEDFARWPEDRRVMLDDLYTAARDCDVYVAPLLRSEPTRRASSALPGPFLYADVDVDTTQPGYEHGRMLDTLLGGGGFAVASGSDGHVHAYVAMQQTPEMVQFDTLNRRLARTLGADAKWDASVVLRLPGTFNHKPRAIGERSAPVVIL